MSQPPAPTDAPKWPKSLYNLRHHVSGRDRPNRPRVHALTRVVALDPPTVRLPADNPLDGEPTTAGKFEHYEGARDWCSIHPDEQEVAITQRRLHRRPTHPDEREARNHHP